MKEQLKIYEEKMDKTIDSLMNDYASIRAGRANPHVLDKIKVDYYGTPTPIQQVGNISVPEARMILIQPWEKSLLKAIEKAIQTADLGINPNNDGSCIRLIFPELTEDRRKELAKDVKKKGENAKVAVRNIRRDANDAFKKAEKAGEITEDELDDLTEKMQKLTDKTITDLEELRSQLVEVRANGYAIDDEENELGVRCVAVAIPGADGRAESAFSISGLAPYMTPERIRRIATLALDARTDILADLGLR